MPEATPPSPDAARAGPERGPADSSEAALVLRQFRVVFNAVRSHFQQVERQVGIGGAQVWALHAVHSRPGLSMNELAAMMDIHQSTASNLVRQLARRQLLRVEKSPADRRSVMLYAEPAGLTVLERVPGPFQGVLPEALQQLPADTLSQLHTHLGALIAVLRADESASGVPLANL